MCAGSVHIHPIMAKIHPVFFFCVRCRGRQKCLQSDWGVLLLDVIMNIAVVIYSRNMSRWRSSGLRLFLKGMRPLIYLNVSMFMRIIRGPASPTEEVSINFSNNVLVSKFRGLKFIVSENGSSSHWREGRGEQSSLAFKGTFNRMGCCKQSWFWQGKYGVFTLPLRHFCQSML